MCLDMLCVLYTILLIITFMSLDWLLVFQQSAKSSLPMPRQKALFGGVFPFGYPHLVLQQHAKSCLHMHKPCLEGFIPSVTLTWFFSHLPNPVFTCRSPVWRGLSLQLSSFGSSAVCRIQPSQVQVDKLCLEGFIPSATLTWFSQSCEDGCPVCGHCHNGSSYVDPQVRVERQARTKDNQTTQDMADTYIRKIDLQVKYFSSKRPKSTTFFFIGRSQIHIL